MTIYQTFISIAPILKPNRWDYGGLGELGLPVYGWLNSF